MSWHERKFQFKLTSIIISQLWSDTKSTFQPTFILQSSYLCIYEDQKRSLKINWICYSPTRLSSFFPSLFQFNCFSHRISCVGLACEIPDNQQWTIVHFRQLNCEFNYLNIAMGRPNKDSMEKKGFCYFIQFTLVYFIWQILPLS